MYEIYINEINIIVAAVTLLIIGVLIERRFFKRRVMQQSINDAGEMFHAFTKSYEQDKNKAEDMEIAAAAWKERRDEARTECEKYNKYIAKCKSWLYEFQKGKGYGKNIKCPCCEEYRRRKDKEPIPDCDDYDHEPEPEKEKKGININL